MENRSNVVRFHAPSAENKPASQHNDSKGDVLWAFRARPAQSKPWMSPAARALVTKKKAASAVEVVAPPPPPRKTIAEILQEAAARPKPPLLDLSSDLKALPSTDLVKATIDTLVPDGCRFSNFLDGWSVLKGRMSIQLENTIKVASEDAISQCILDINTLTKTALKERYPEEYSSHKNRKYQAARNGWYWHPDFDDFTSFLRIMGPIPGPDYTLDCINPNVHEYAPDKCRWLDKRGQVQNRRNTKKATYDGVTAAIAIWAEVTDQPYDRLYARLKKGWSDEEVIFGKGGRSSFGQRPWNQHDDDTQREKAESFYQAHKLPGEAPLAFCLRYARRGLNPWGKFLSDYVCPYEDGFSGIAPQCLPEIEAAQKLVIEFAPVLRWLESTWRRLQSPITIRKEHKDSNRQHSVSLEIAIQNHCESFPELDYDEDDEPL